MRIGCLLLIMALPVVFAGEAKPSDIEGVWCRDASSAFQLGVHDKNAGLTFDKQGCWHIHIEHADHNGGVAKYISERSKDIKNVYPIKRHVLEVYDEKKKQYTIVSPGLLAFYVDRDRIYFTMQSLSSPGQQLQGVVHGKVLKFLKMNPVLGIQLSTASVKYAKLTKVEDYVEENFNKQWEALKKNLAEAKSKLRTDLKKS